MSLGQCVPTDLPMRNIHPVIDMAPSASSTPCSISNTMRQRRAETGLLSTVRWQDLTSESSQLHRRHTVSPFGSIARAKLFHIGRIFEILSQDRFESAGSMAVNDSQIGGAAERRPI